MALFRRDVLQNAERLVSKGKIEAAIKEFKKVLADDPEDANTLNRLGDLLVRVHKNDEAANYYTQTAERFANDGFYLKAIAVYKKVQRIQPARSNLIRRLAELYEKQGLISDARAHFLQYAEIAVRDDNIRFASEAFEHLVELEPDDPTHRLRLADLYRRRDLLDKAVETYFTIAEMMLQHARFDHARQVFERAIEITPKNLDVARRAVTALRDAGGEDAARRLINTTSGLNMEIGELVDLLVAPDAAQAIRDTGSRTTQFGDASLEGEELPVVVSPDQAPSTEPEEPAAVSSSAALEDLSSGDEPTTVDAVLELDLEAGPEQPSLAEASSAWEVEEETTLTGAVTDLDESLPEPAALTGTSEEVELIVDIEDEEPPPTLVQPPPDVGDEIGFGALKTGEQEQQKASEGQATAQAASEPVAEAAATVPEEDLDLDLELDLELSGELSMADDLAAEEALPAASAEIEPAELQLEASSAVEQPEAPVPEVGHALQGAQDEAPAELREDAAEATEGTKETELELVLDEEMYASADESFEPAALVPPDSDATWEPIHVEGHVAETEVAAQAAAEPEGSSVELQTRVQDLLSEADVFLKYGLYQKSRERLTELLKVDPRFVAAHTRLVRLALEEGAEERILSTVLQAQELASELGDAAATEEIVHALADAGYRIDHGQLVAEATGVHPRLLPEPPPPPSRPSLAPQTAEPSKKPSPMPYTGEGSSTGMQSVGEVSGASWLDDILPEGSQKAKDDVFDQEGQFFDLAAELQEELEESERAAPEEPSLEAIVEGFKKGVSENIAQEDSDTHYNLGIAYREMFLLDEAIGEFQISARSPQYLVDSCAMLALCYKDKGMPDLAAKWYRKALSSGRAGVEQRIGMLYELGALLEQLDDRDGAYQAYFEVYSADATFRDVADKLAQLQQPV